MTKLTIRKPYDRVTSVGFKCRDDGVTQQSHRSSCDVNNILRRFETTGVMEHAKEHGGDYADFLDCPQSYHAAMSQVVRAQQMFDDLPAAVRKRFANDPGDFLHFVENAPDEALREVGLLPPESPSESESAVARPEDAAGRETPSAESAEGEKTSST